MKIFDFENICLTFGDTPALVHQQSISYNQYVQVINSTIQRLKSHHILAKDRVAVYSQNTIYYPVILLALIKLGATAVPVSDRFPVNKIEEMLASINCDKMIIDENFNFLSHNNFTKIIPMNDLVQGDSFNEENFTDTSFSFKQDATIFFTSGSSGNPKAVLHSFGNHYYSALGSNENIPFIPGDRWLLSLPLYHVGGLAIIFRAIISGGTLVFPDNRLDIIENIEKNQITHISLVSTQLYRLIKQKNSSDILKNLKVILVGGSQIPSGLIKKAIQNNLPIFTTFGSTEMASQITTTKSGEKSQKLFTAGKPLKYRKIIIAHDGEILVKGDTLFRGYVEGKNTVRPFDTDGWFPSGDLGKIDNDGYLTVIGRKDNMFISGGENIHPEEIENILLNLQGISQALVVDIADEEFGARPVAFIEFDKNNSITNEMVSDYLFRSLPRFKIPIAYYRWPGKFRGMKPDRIYFKSLINKLSADRL